MKAPVDKQACEVLGGCRSIGFCLARGLPNVEEDLTVVFPQGKREDIGDVRLFSIGLVHPSGELITTDDE